jgi:hypothetical protein
MTSITGRPFGISLCYSFAPISEGLYPMPLLDPMPVAGRFSLRGLVVWLAAASLVVALAQRTF